MNRRNFLVGSAAVPFAPTAFGYSEEKPLGFDLPRVSNLDELEAAVNEVSKHFHRRFNGKMGPKQAVTHKNNEYITFINGFPPMEFSPIDLFLGDTPQEALNMFYWGIEKYASPYPSKRLVWRIWPETTFTLAKKKGVDWEDGKYKIRTRLVFE